MIEKQFENLLNRINNRTIIKLRIWFPSMGLEDIHSILFISLGNCMTKVFIHLKLKRKLKLLFANLQVIISNIIDFKMLFCDKVSTQL